MPTNPQPCSSRSDLGDQPTRPPTRRRVRVGLSLGVVMVGLAAAAAACSGSSAATQAATGAGGPATSSIPAAPPGSTGGNRQAYVDCLAQHGVTVPSRGGNGDGGGGFGNGGFGGNRGTGPAATDQATQDARNACASLRPAGGGQGGQAFQAYATCMRDNGVTMPTGGGQGPAATDNTGRRTRPTIDQSDPKVAAANGKCQQLLPNGGQGNGSRSNGGATP